MSGNPRSTIHEIGSMAFEFGAASARSLQPQTDTLAIAATSRWRVNRQFIVDEQDDRCGHATSSAQLVCDRVVERDRQC